MRMAFENATSRSTVTVVVIAIELGAALNASVTVTTTEVSACVAGLGTLQFHLWVTVLADRIPELDATHEPGDGMVPCARMVLPVPTRL